MSLISYQGEFKVHIICDIVEYSLSCKELAVLTTEDTLEDLTEANGATLVSACSTGGNLLDSASEELFHITVIIILNKRCSGMHNDPGSRDNLLSCK